MCICSPSYKGAIGRRIGSPRIRIQTLDSPPRKEEREEENLFFWRGGMQYTGFNSGFILVTDTLPLSHASSPFTLVILETGAHVFAWTTILLVYTSHHSWDDRSEPLCPASFWLRLILENFFSRTSLELQSSRYQPPTHLRWQVCATAPSYCLR
jgi:hypothetical protein